MHVGLYFAPEHIDELSLRDQTVVVLDILRAGSSIATALANGAKEIIPVNTVERAVKISGSLFGDHILRGGERHGRIIEGFDLGNSPLEYSRERVEGKSIIFSTTNGSRAIDKARYAREVVVGGFVNLSALLGFVRTGGRDVVILCSGDNGRFSMEDSVCAGMILHQLSENPGTELSMTDASLAAVALYKTFGKSIPKMIRNSEHGRYLAELGFTEDLEYCARVDALSTLPQLVGNVVRLKPEKTAVSQKAAAVKAG
jgi:2-phosphosulfolactate phosphatase